MRSYWIRVSPKSNDWCPYNRRRGHREGHVKMDRDWSDAATSQKMPRILGNCQKLGRDKEGF